MTPRPHPQRPEVPLIADERPMLEAWLEYHRATLLLKCEGLSESQLKARSAAPSNLTLLGLVRHLTEVECGWFRRRIGGQPDLAGIYSTAARPDADFEDVDTADPATTFSAYRAELERCRAAASGVALETIVSDKYSVRWIYLHMIEEYARHNGHADLLRERIDGATGE